jgi:ATP-dependent RNA helicase RhlE
MVSSRVGLEPSVKGVISISKQSFSALGASPPVVDALSARGMHAPFRIQELVIPDAIQGVDVLAKSPTGSGKTIAFAVPLAERTSHDGPMPAALVLVPTRELAVQVTKELQAVGAAQDLRVASVYGGAALRAQAKHAARAHILVATPGRLQDLVERRLVSLADVRILVLDEADRMLDMGFKPQVEKLVRRLPTERQTMLFSATLDGEVGELARAFTRNPSRFEHDPQPSADLAEVNHRFASVSADDKVDRLIQELEAERGLALVFVRTKRGADRLAKRLARQNVAAVALHGDMSQPARERALERFRSGKVKTLIATDVAARGLDLVEITHVINYDPPEDDKGYVHRVGRTGRAGRSGSGITFVLPEQQNDVSRVAARLGHRQQFEHSGMSTAPLKRVYTSRRGRRSKW